MAAKSAFWLLALLVLLRTAAAQTYRLDSNRAEASFEVDRFGLRWVRAHFRDIAGQFTIDRSGAVVRVDIDIGTASVDCPDPQWNSRLRSAEWLDVQRFPRMIFHSNRIELAENQAVASGELTLHGVTRPVMLDVNLRGCANRDDLKADCQFSARGRIKRSDYGLPHGFWTGGDEVAIAMSGTAQALAQ